MIAPSEPPTRNSASIFRLTSSSLFVSGMYSAPGLKSIFPPGTPVNRRGLYTQPSPRPTYLFTPRVSVKQRYDWSMPGEASQQNSMALAVLRIGVGAFFLIFGEYKVFGTQFTLHGGFQFLINKILAEGGGYAFMAPILRDFVLAHATPIAFLVAYSEFAIGLALLLGVLVRTASVCGL